MREIMKMFVVHVSPTTKKKKRKKTKEKGENNERDVEKSLSCTTQAEDHISKTKIILRYQLATVLEGA